MFVNMFSDLPQHPMHETLMASEDPNLVVIVSENRNMYKGLTQF